jgi:predicted RNase H-like HicB family nuclease
MFIVEELMRQVIIYTDEDGKWCATCPSLPGCHSQGDSYEDTLVNIREAIELWIEDALERGESIPDDVEVHVAQV